MGTRSGSTRSGSFLEVNKWQNLQSHNPIMTRSAFMKRERN